MGKSRSATICIAYLLHQQRSGHTPQSALDLVRQGRPLCEPNEGFMDQLELYHEMGCPEQVADHPLYQRWLYRREVEDSVACGRAPEMRSVRFEDELPQRVQDGDNDGSSVEIKCRKCRFVLISLSSVVAAMGPGNTDLDKIPLRRELASTPYIISHEQEKRDSAKTRSNTECAHIFLHPMRWMASSLFPSGGRPGENTDAPLSGRLTCPNSSCGANIGKFAWQGMQCSCNHWVVPALCLAKARVDIKSRGPRNLPPASMGIRLPPGMRPPAEDNNRGKI